MFAERAGRVILFFDANRMVVSGKPVVKLPSTRMLLYRDCLAADLRSCIERMKGLEKRFRIVLNKADSVNAAELFRVYAQYVSGSCHTTDNMLSFRADMAP